MGVFFFCTCACCDIQNPLKLSWLFGVGEILLRFPNLFLDRFKQETLPHAFHPSVSEPLQKKWYQKAQSNKCVKYLNTKHNRTQNQPFTTSKKNHPVCAFVFFFFSQPCNPRSSCPIPMHNTFTQIHAQAHRLYFLLSAGTRPLQSRGLIFYSWLSYISSARATVKKCVFSTFFPFLQTATIDPPPHKHTRRGNVFSPCDVV